MSVNAIPGLRLLEIQILPDAGDSGQIQHMVGANGVKRLSPPQRQNAPIFNHADYGLVISIKVVPAPILAS